MWIHKGHSNTCLYTRPKSTLFGHVKTSIHNQRCWSVVQPRCGPISASPYETGCWYYRKTLQYSCSLQWLSESVRGLMIIRVVKSRQPRPIGLSSKWQTMIFRSRQSIYDQMWIHYTEADIYSFYKLIIQSDRKYTIKINTYNHWRILNTQLTEEKKNTYGPDR